MYDVYIYNLISCLYSCHVYMLPLFCWMRLQLRKCSPRRDNKKTCCTSQDAVAQIDEGDAVGETWIPPFLPTPRPPQVTWRCGSEIVWSMPMPRLVRKPGLIKGILRENDEMSSIAGPQATHFL